MHVTEIEQVAKPVILIVDDQEIQRAVLVKHFTAWFNDKYILAEASNGQEALDFFAKNKNDHVIKLITMNILMPVMNGLDAIANIRKLESWRDEKRPPFVPIVVLSATLDHHINKLQSLRYDRGVQLPCDYDLLRSMVSSLLHPPLIKSLV